jgi:flagellin
VSDTERAFIDSEYQALITEVNAIETAVTFNGDALLDAGFNFNVLVGANAADIIALDLSGVDADATAIGFNGDVTTNANAVTALGAVEGAINAIVADRAIVGALQSRFGFREQVIAAGVDNTSNAASSILDADIAAEQTNLTNKRVLTEAAIAGLSQANQLTESFLALLR